MANLTVRDIYDGIDGFAPFATAEPWDNVGLLVGDPSREVTRILVTLDVTLAVVREAVDRRCELIVSHHPVLFRAAKSLREDDPSGRLLGALVRGGVSLIAAHTNWDKADGGVQDVLANRLGLLNIRPLTMGRIGFLPGRATLAQLLELAQDRLALPHPMPPMRMYGPAEALVHQIAVVGGSGLDDAMIREARESGADALVTGDVRHHDALDALGAGLRVIDAGHVMSEFPSIDVLRNGLQSLPNVIKYRTQVFVSETIVYG